MSGPPPHAHLTHGRSLGSGSAPRAARAAWIKARRMRERRSEAEVMLGWRQEVPRGGAGLRPQGPAAPPRPAPHGAAGSWSSFILQSRGIAGEPNRAGPTRAGGPRPGPNRTGPEPRHKVGTEQVRASIPAGRFLRLKLHETLKKNFLKTL